LLIRLLREYLRPYAMPVALVATLQIAQTAATLYLPALNTDIIGNGCGQRRHRTHPAHGRCDARGDRPLSAALQARIEEINRLVREQITGVRVIRAFVRDDHERKRFAGTNDSLTAVALRLGRTQALMMPAVMLVVEFSTIAVLWFGGPRVDADRCGSGRLSRSCSTSPRFCRA
jgi:ABC-type multidrug transport system fused ATPase/permease subunit